MLNKLKGIFGKAKDAVSSAATQAADLNGDGKVDTQDAKIAAEWAKDKASAVGDEASRLGKNVMQSDLGRDVAAGAAIGAAVAIPLPVVGPVAGAVVGAGLGVYKNIIGKHPSSGSPKQSSLPPKDFHTSLLQLEELRQKGILTDAEFEVEKKKILAAT